MNPDLIKLLIGAAVRQVITGTGVILAAHGMPKIEDGTATNLTNILSGAALVVASFAWSWIQKKMHVQKIELKNDAIVSLIGQVESANTPPSEQPSNS